VRIGFSFVDADEALDDEGLCLATGLLTSIFGDVAPSVRFCDGVARTLSWLDAWLGLLCSRVLGTIVEASSEESRFISMDSRREVRDVEAGSGVFPITGISLESAMAAVV
jgi:hypothetical protein